MGKVLFFPNARLAWARQTIKEIDQKIEKEAKKDLWRMPILAVVVTLWYMMTKALEILRDPITSNLVFCVVCLAIMLFFFMWVSSIVYLWRIRALK